MQRPLTPHLYKVVEDILVGKLNVPFKERFPLQRLAHQKIKCKKYQFIEVHNPLIGCREHRIVSAGKIVAKTTEVTDIIQVPLH